MLTLGMHGFFSNIPFRGKYPKQEHQLYRDICTVINTQIYIQVLPHLNLIDKFHAMSDSRWLWADNLASIGAKRIPFSILNVGCLNLCSSKRKFFYSCCYFSTVWSPCKLDIDYLIEAWIKKKTFEQSTSVILSMLLWGNYFTVLCVVSIKCFKTNKSN